jgi:hypothetical protein
LAPCVTEKKREERIWSRPKYLFTCSLAIRQKILTSRATKPTAERNAMMGG